VKKRGLPEGYVRGLEKLWGLTIREVEGVEDNVLLVITGDDGNDTLSSVWNDDGNSDNLVEIWRKSQISRELERLLAIVEPPIENGKRKRTDSDSHAGRKVGPSGVQSVKDQEKQKATPSTSGGWPNRKLDIRAPEVAQDSPTLSDIYDSGRFMRRDLESILSPQYPNPASVNSIKSPEVPDLPSETWHLLDVYFSYTHSWLPIIEKHDLLRTSYQYSQNRNDVPIFGYGSGDHAALWAAIAYAKFQHRAINNIPHAQGPVADMVWTAERMYSQARSLIPNEEGVFELGHVQALLILALTNMGIGHLNRAWFLIGQAVRVATYLGLDRPSNDILKAFSKSRTKHVFLGCFVLDTIIAARLDHRPHLRAEDVDIVGLVEEDGLEEWDPWTDCLTVRRGSTGSRGPASVLSTFNRLVEVLQILNEATCLSDSSKRLQLSTGLLEKIHIWSQTQAKSAPLYFDSSTTNSEKATSLLPHHHNLHLAYFTTLVTSQLLSHDQGSESVNLEPCTRSARQIVELLRQHSNSFGLLIVPPTFEYFIKTAYDVVRAVKNSTENTHITLDDWKRNLDNCLDGMEPAWQVFEFFKNSSSYQPNPPISNGRRESQVAYDLISGMQTADTPMSGKTPGSIANYDAMTPFSPQIYRSQPQQLNISQPVKMSSPVSTRTASFGQASVQNLPLNLQESPQAMFNGSNPMATDAWSRLNQSGNMGQPYPPHLQHAMSIGSEAEIDPAFNEFAALDAMEWFVSSTPSSLSPLTNHHRTGNWDQSLVNLGFTDRDNMNQDFYAMSREPDPLFPNSVFQQLVANSNAEATDFLDGSMFGSMGMGGFGMGFGDENEGIEAGQILQALSAAEDQRVPGRGNG
jgi:hypothetical protein